MIKQFRYYILLIFFFSGIVTSYAQYENTSNDTIVRKQEKKQPLQKRDRWFVGGMLGGGFGSTSTYSEWYIELAPIVGYKVTPNFHVGTRITYIFNSILYKATPILPEERINYNHYGVGAFGRYIIFKGLFAQVEYEALNYDKYNNREWINSLFIGGGYYQSIGRTFASIAILFNVLDNINSPYVNPIIRIGFGIGF